MKEISDHDNNFQPSEKSKNAHFSLPGGLKVKFHDESNAILFWVSSFTGNEKVLVNNEIVSKKRTFGRYTKHRFQFNGNDYVIEFNIKSLAKYTWSCTLFRNGTLLKKFELKDTHSDKSFFIKYWEFILGGFVGAAYAFGYIPLYSVFVFLLIVILGSLFSFWYTQWNFEIGES